MKKLMKRGPPVPAPIREEEYYIRAVENKRIRDAMKKFNTKASGQNYQRSRGPDE